MSHDQLRQLCISKELSAGGNTDQKMKRLLNKKANDELERQEAQVKAKETVLVDTEPGWALKYSISLPICPPRGATGPQCIKKDMEKIWADDFPEPATSIDIAKKISDLLKADDRSRSERLRFIVHWCRVNNA